MFVIVMLADAYNSIQLMKFDRQRNSIAHFILKIDCKRHFYVLHFRSLPKPLSLLIYLWSFKVLKETHDLGNKWKKQ